MNVPSPPVIRPDEFPDEEPRLLALISEGLRDLSHGLQRIPESFRRSGSFLSAPSGVTTVDVKNLLGRKPEHVTVSVRREDLADFSAAWSWWFVMAGESVRLKFVGLPISTRHVYTIEVS